KPIILVQLQFHRLRFREIVVHDDRHAHFVAARESDRQIEIDEERLKNADARLGRTKSAVARHRACRQSPSGDRIGEVDIETGMTVVVSDEFRPPKERFRELFSYAGASTLVRTCLITR